jgi:uncharacterized membrane protein (DUF373 family)
MKKKNVNHVMNLVTIVSDLMIMNVMIHVQLIDICLLEDVSLIVQSISMKTEKKDNVPHVVEPVLNVMVLDVMEIVYLVKKVDSYTSENV